jgi:xylan 1,4-beta-xylosidase
MTSPLLSADFHAQHGAFGAYGSFTLGKFGDTGGFCVHDGRKPGSDDVYVGILHDDGQMDLLPFYKAAGRDTAAFAVKDDGKELHIRSIPASAVRRTMGLGRDLWESPDLSFCLDTPFWPLPQLHESPLFAKAVLPAVTGSLRVDNRNGSRAVLALIGLCGEELGTSTHRENGVLSFQRQGREGIAVADAPGLMPFAGFALERCFGKDLKVRAPHLLGACMGFAVRVEAGQELSLPFALGWHVAGQATSGEPTQYAYLRHFHDLPSVLHAALEQGSERAERALAMDAEIAVLSDDRAFLLAHATRGYHACSQLLRDRRGRLLHVVNEGEYCMMNTLDLSVDHAFFESRFYPWALESLLDLFLERHSFKDRLKVGEELHDGGISFCHDMGVRNVFAAPGTSSYEIPDKDRCFSHMTSEELCNWILLASIHGISPQGRAWARRNRETILACQESLLRREHPDAACRKGWFETDSDRCGTATEITTYDSLDASLAYARGSLYLATKAWACHLGLARLLGDLDLTDSVQLSEAAAHRSAVAISGVKRLENGCLPAHFTGSASAILPAIEALIYPWWWQDRDAVSETGRFGMMVTALKDHCLAALVPGVCISKDGALRLSSTSDITWMSKSFLCQTVAERIFLQEPEAGADAMHARWQREGMGHWGFTDQIVDGRDVGSRLYPRGVTSWTWLL